MFSIKKIIISLIRIYKAIISPFLPPNTCRFYPTCSSFALDAILKYGTVKGSIMSLRRIVRCHPFHPGGYDPVP
ncbi:MAG: membrane protein insertion efficiency factor YidD [Bacteroidota bacterium]|nr:membrane protein insertion efficiency factor YidD [Bacteroidota bacterium]